MLMKYIFWLLMAALFAARIVLLALSEAKVGPITICVIGVIVAIWGLFLDLKDKK